MGLKTVKILAFVNKTKRLKHEEIPIIITLIFLETSSVKIDLRNKKTKYVKKATAHMSYLEPVMWKYINNQETQNVKDLFKEIISETDKPTKQEAVKESRRYIMNNWEGIKRQYDKEYIGCSAEGHVSHILADRLSSRPLGWSHIGADQMARLRTFRANGGNVYGLVERVHEKRKNQERVMKLDKRIIKSRLNKKVVEKIDNITILNIGKRTWANEFLKSIRGA